MVNWKTMVLVVDYPEDREKELEKMLKPLVAKVNTSFGEIWQPYNGPKYDALSSILEDIKDLLLEKIKPEPVKPKIDPKN